MKTVSKTNEKKCEKTPQGISPVRYRRNINDESSLENYINIYEKCQVPYLYLYSALI